MNNKLLVTIATENYLEQAKQMFASAHLKGAWNGDYLLLTFNVPEEKLKQFRKKNIIVKQCQPLCDLSEIRTYKGSKSPSHTMATINKLYLFSEYFKKWENIVFIDADVIIKASIEELGKVKKFNATEDGLPNIGCQFIEFGNIIFEEDQKNYERIKKGINLKEKTFSSGVMAFDTSIIKRKTFPELIELFKKYKNICAFEEQTILNIFFYKKWRELPLIYNASNFFAGFDDKTAVIHTATDLKAWDPASPFYKEWKENLEKYNTINFLKSRTVQKKFAEKEILEYSNILKQKYAEGRNKTKEKIYNLTTKNFMDKENKYKLIIFILSVMIVLSSLMGVDYLQSKYAFLIVITLFLANLLTVVELYTRIQHNIDKSTEKISELKNAVIENQKEQVDQIIDFLDVLVDYEEQKKTQEEMLSSIDSSIKKLTENGRTEQNTIKNQPY